MILFIDFCSTLSFITLALFTSERPGHFTPADGLGACSVAVRGQGRATGFDLRGRSWHGSKEQRQMPWSELHVDDGVPLMLLPRQSLPAGRSQALFRL